MRGICKAWFILLLLGSGLGTPAWASVPKAVMVEDYTATW